MAMSTVIPPLSLPTEGDYLCATDFTNVPIGAVTLLLCLCGLVGNAALLCLLGFFIHSKAITVYIFHMAITDCVFLILVVPFALLFILRSMSRFILCYVPREYLGLLYLPLLSSYNLGLFLLTVISFNRCRSILCPLWCRCHHAQQQSKVVSAMVWAISTAVIPTLTSLLVSNKVQHFILTAIIMEVLNFLFFASSTVICSTYIFIKVMCGCEQQPLGRLDIVIFFTVLLGLPSGICNFLLLFLCNIHPAVLFLLACIPSSIKPFIYFSVARCWRHSSIRSLRLSLQSILGEPEETTAHSNDDTTATAV